MDMKLDNKIAIVTGAARGLGKAIADKLASEGATVVLADILDDLGEANTDAIRERGHKAHYIHCDIGSAKQVDNLVQSTLALYDKIDILVNNAGIAVYKLMEDYTEDEWDRVINVNLKSTYLLMRRIKPIMVENGGGAVILIASVHARITATTVTSYVATKGAVVSMTRTMALEGAPHNIRVNCISPGAFATPMLLENWGDVPADQHPLVPRIPLNRIGRPEELAEVALFLASDASSYMTGSEVLVDGGLSAHFD